MAIDPTDQGTGTSSTDVASDASRRVTRGPRRIRATSRSATRPRPRRRHCRRVVSERRRSSFATIIVKIHERFGTAGHERSPVERAIAAARGSDSEARPNGKRSWADSNRRNERADSRYGGTRSVPKRRVVSDRIPLPGQYATPEREVGCWLAASSRGRRCARTSLTSCRPCRRPYRPCRRPCHRGHRRACLRRRHRGRPRGRPRR